MSFTYEKLNDKIKVCISKEHRFGTDAFLLANFSAPLKKDRVCDLGCGCGIIPLILKRDFSPREIYGIDIQPKAVEQFELSISESGLSDIFPLCADLKEAHTLISPLNFDLVTCNPPYKAANSGIISELDSDKIARHEVMCGIEDVCLAASKLLRFGGRLCLCQRPERLADVISAMRKAKIEPKRLRFVSKSPGNPPWLFLIEGKKGGKPFMKVEPELYIYGENGFSDELLKIYADGKGEKIEG